MTRCLATSSDDPTSMNMEAMVTRSQTENDSLDQNRRVAGFLNKNNSSVDIIKPALARNMNFGLQNLRLKRKNGNV
jgi:hypothetical protein